jgi:hypothetical protein
MEYFLRQRVIVDRDKPTELRGCVVGFGTVVGFGSNLVTPSVIIELDTVQRLSNGGVVSRLIAHPDNVDQELGD